MHAYKSTLLFSLLLILILLSIAATYFRYLELRDYEIIDDTEETELEDNNFSE